MFIVQYKYKYTIALGVDPSWYGTSTAVFEDVVTVPYTIHLFIAPSSNATCTVSLVDLYACTLHGQQVRGPL